MIKPKELPGYRWPDLSAVKRLYLVVDDRGRYGIATTSAYDDVLWVRPLGVPPCVPLPEYGNNAILMTAMSWSPQADGSYRGFWADDDVPTFPVRVPPEKIRTLYIVEDLGWIMPDWVADEALRGSDKMGAWNYGATLGKVGGEPPVKGMRPDEISVAEAVDYAREVGEMITARGLRRACASGYITGARRIGRDWVIPLEGLNHYLDNRPRRGRKPKTLHIDTNVTD